MTEKIDLHTHSTHSDGRDSVASIFDTAADAGLAWIALTDHDSTAGWAEAVEASARTGVGFVPGIEVTTRARVVGADGETYRFGVHMLAYLPDPNNQALAGALKTSVESREHRLREIVSRISQDFDVTWQDVLDQLSDGATMGRPALADALIAKGHFTQRGDVFDNLFYRGSKYHVPNTGVPETIEAIELIREAGGVPVIAHPLSRGKGPGPDDPMPLRHFEEMIEAGLAGFECHHRDVPEHARQWLLGLAEKHDLIVTGSSDYHGETGKPNRLGEKTTSPEMFERILAQATGSKPIG